MSLCYNETVFKSELNVVSMSEVNLSSKKLCCEDGF